MTYAKPRGQIKLKEASKLTDAMDITKVECVTAQALMGYFVSLR